MALDRMIYVGYGINRNQSSYTVCVIAQKWSHSKHIRLHSAIRTERHSVHTVWMLVCTLSSVTPPLVNTGLEVSSVDKNTLASQQRGRKARIPLSPEPIVHQQLKTSTFIISNSWIFFAFCSEKVECKNVD